jgi:hypothetical protein
LPLGFAFHRLVLKLSTFKKRRMQGNSQIGQKRVMILKEVKAYIRKYLRVACGIWERRHFHCNFGVQFSGNWSLHDYNFASSGHIALKQSRRIAVYDCLVGPSFLLLSWEDICKSGKHWCLVGYTQGGKSAHSLEKCDKGLSRLHSITDF